MGWQSELGVALENSIREVPNRSGILFSGGLDSSFIAFLMKRAGRDVQLYSACAPSSHDSAWAPRAAGLLGIPIEVLIENDEEIVEGIGAIKEMTGETSTMMILIELPLYFVSGHSSESILLTGQGADELFMGYKKYEREDTSKADLRNVIDYVVPLERRIAANYGKEIIYPYLQDAVVRVASNISHEENVRDGVRKHSLRSVAWGMKMNDELSWKQKKASQYSSGFKDAISRMAKKKNKTVHEFVSEL